MSLSEDAKLAALNDHYKDTCTWVRERLCVRERLMLAILAVLGIQYLQFENPSESATVTVTAFKSVVDLKLLANVNALNSIVWFLLLATILRYYQTNIYINRQYKYLHKLEKDFETLFKVNFVNREGHAYLKDYPYFSDWTHGLYTIVFPALLLISTTAKIVSDWNGNGAVLGTFGVSFLIYLMILVSTVLYLIFLHLKKEKKKP